MTTPFPLGRFQDHDPRSRAFPALTGPTVASVLWPTYGPRLDQGSTSSCTGNAMAAWLNSKPAHKPRAAYLTETDALSLYSTATRLDPFPGEYPPDDDGSSGLAVCKAANQAGLIRSYTWAFGITHLMEALQKAPVLVGVQWYDSMFYPSASGYVEIAGGIAGGHEFLIQGLNLRDRYVWAVNSWGKGWGLGGRFKIPLTAMDRLLQEGGDCSVPVL